MDIARISKIFAELESLSVTLPRNAADLGPQFMSEQISLTRGYSNQVSFYLQEVLSERTHLALILDNKQTQFEVRSDELLSQDSRVKALASLADRQAMINYIEKDLKAEIDHLKSTLASLVNVEKVIRLRMRELDNTSSDIRTQRNLLRDQLKLGLIYGDETQPAEKKSDISTDELNNIVSLGSNISDDLGDLDFGLNEDLDEKPEDLANIEDPDLISFLSSDYT
jgi:hypothetical protein